MPIGGLAAYIEVLKKPIQNNIDFVIKQELLDDDKLRRYD